MAKNIEMSVLGSDGSYEVLYPYTIPSQVEDLLNNDTKVYIGLNENSTPDDAFRSLYLLNVLQGKIVLTLTVKDSATGTPMEGIQIACSSYCDAKGNPIAGPIETNSKGKIDVFCSVSNPTLSISGYFDIEDYSQQFTYELGNSYSAEWNITTRNFLKITSSTTKMFSINVNSIDVCCVGGGGGGAAGTGGGGGGGGYCVIQENTPFTTKTNIVATIGSGGIGGIYRSSRPFYSVATAGGTTTFLNVSANGGGFGNVGLGHQEGIGNGNGGYVLPVANYAVGYDATPGTVAGYSSFTETVVYGGGGGGYNDNDSADEGWSVRTKGAGYGGTTENYPNNINGQSGFGGGGSSYRTGMGMPSAGNGGSGCVAIRMHLKTAV